MLLSQYPLARSLTRAPCQPPTRVVRAPRGQTSKRIKCHRARLQPFVSSDTRLWSHCAQISGYARAKEDCHREQEQESPRASRDCCQSEAGGRRRGCRRAARARLHGHRRRRYAAAKPAPLRTPANGPRARCHAPRSRSLAPPASHAHARPCSGAAAPEEPEHVDMAVDSAGAPPPLARPAEAFAGARLRDCCAFLYPSESERPGKLERAPHRLASASSFLDVCALCHSLVFQSKPSRG